MSKTLKGILIALAVVVLIGAGWLIGRGSGGGTIEHVVPFSLSVNAAGDFAVTITPADQECIKGAVVTYAIAVIPSGGFDAPVHFTVAGLPAGSYSLASETAGPGAWTTTLTVNTATLQTNSTYSCNLTAVDE
jgi:hypothetical protein